MALTDLTGNQLPQLQDEDACATQCCQTLYALLRQFAVLEAKWTGATTAYAALGNTDAIPRSPVPQSQFAALNRTQGDLNNVISMLLAVNNVANTPTNLGLIGQQIGSDNAVL